MSTGALTIAGTGDMLDFSSSDERWGGNTIKSVSIGDEVTSIGDYAFHGCTSLSAITILEGVLYIPSYAFYNCTSLSAITLPKDVISIGYYAFGNCTSLSAITIPEGVRDIGGTAFHGCTSLSAINVDASNLEYSSVDGILLNKAKTKLILCPDGKSSTSITIPVSVTSIEYRAFFCTNVKEIIFPAGIAVKVQDGSFINCILLEKITVAKNANVTFEDGAILFDDDMKHPIHVDAPKDYRIPDGALDGDIEITYGDSPVDPDGGGFPIVIVAVIVVAIIAIVGVIFARQKGLF